MNADLLSRLLLPDMLREVLLPGETILLRKTLESSPVTASQIKTWTDRDPLLSNVRDFILRRWEIADDNKLKPYQWCQHELSVQDGCLLWGNRVKVPTIRSVR